MEEEEVLHPWDLHHGSDWSWHSAATADTIDHHHPQALPGVREHVRLACHASCALAAPRLLGLGEQLEPSEPQAQRPLYLP